MRKGFIQTINYIKSWAPPINRFRGLAPPHTLDSSYAPALGKEAVSGLLMLGHYL